VSDTAMHNSATQNVILMGPILPFKKIYGDDQNVFFILLSSFLFLSVFVFFLVPWFHLFGVVTLTLSRELRILGAGIDELVNSCLFPVKYDFFASHLGMIFTSLQ
jgi:hypothetical protein